MLRRSLTAFIPRSLIPARNFFISPKHLYYTDGPREPTAPIPDRIPNWTNDLKEIFGKLKNNSNVFLHGGAATPSHLLLSLHKYVMGENLKGIKLFHIHTEGPYPFTEGESAKHFRSSSLFVAKNCRSAINSGIADYTPIYLSEIPHLFRRNLIPLEFALINVSKPDIHGFCSLGPSIDIARAAVQNAKFIVAQVNRHVPFSRGDAGIHISHIDYLVQCDEPLHEMGSSKIYPEDVSIGKIISEKLVSDGATIQMGIGSIPEVVLSQLGGHKHLGVHTEMFSDGLVDLVKAGAITNALKFNRPGKIVATFVIGSKKVYDFIDNNPLVDMVDVSWVNSPYVIAQNPQPTSINSCIEVDITGQVVSGSIGDKIYSGFGGQIDFLRGAATAQDGQGKAILAMHSMTKKNESKIVPYIKLGAGVVATRANVHYIVTEHGIAYLFGKSLRQRAHALIQIAHPMHREALEKAAFKRLNCMPSID